MVQQLHEAIGHAGVNALKRRCKKLKVFVKKLSTYHVSVESSCAECARILPTQRPIQMDEIRSDVSGNDFSMDLAGPLPTARCKFFLMVAKVLSSLILQHHGITTIRCDQGPHFKNDRIKQFCILQGIRMILTIPYCHSTNGIAKRGIRTTKEWIVKNAPKTWFQPETLLELNQYLLTQERVERPAPEINGFGVPPDVFQVGDTV